MNEQMSRYHLTIIWKGGSVGVCIGVGYLLIIPFFMRDKKWFGSGG